MSLPAAEERALASIEQSLRSRDPRLNAIFSIFTRLTRYEAMPTIEQIRRRRRRPRAGALVLVTLALVVCAVVAGSLATSRGCAAARPAATNAAQPSAIAAAGALVPQCTASHQSLGPKTP